MESGHCLALAARRDKSYSSAQSVITDVLFIKEQDLVGKFSAKI